jgi:hypothetical protein
MNYTITCSYGEIVDKITILEIKLSKCKNEIQKQNVLNEYNLLYIHIKDKQNDEIFKNLYDQLYKINKKLWILEDIIREKSKKKEFDNKYIDCAENIHKKNDERYSIKKKINITYNSYVIEEKIYKNDYNECIEKLTIDLNNNTSITFEDNNILNTCSSCFETGEFLKSKKLLKKICDKHKTTQICEYIIKLYFSYNTVMEVFNEKNEYENKLHEIIDIINNNKNQLDKNFIKEIEKTYGLTLLRQQKYIESHKYIKYLQPVTSPEYSIHPETMGFFKDSDTNKTLLIYFAGGIGDILMHARFIKHICEDQLEKKNGNKIIFLVNDNLFWIYNYIYKNIYSHINNILIVSFIFKDSLPTFDYHVNICTLFTYLKLEYSNIYVDYYLQDLPSSNLNTDLFISKTKPNIIINWLGNKESLHEKYNRSVPLNKLVSLFQKTNHFINWICVQKNITNEDKKLLKIQNVHFIGDQIDNDGDSFKDTITIMKHINLVISTDTSIVHVAGTANVPCWCLLTKGCEWRWTRDEENTRWYPNIKLIRQKNILDWSNVIEEILENLKKMFSK